VIDPRRGRQRADFYHLDDQGEYRLFATEEDEQVKSPVVPGFWLRPAWLWQVDTLDPLLTFCEMAGLSETAVNQFCEQMQAGFKR
jgi:hypothetical protein